MSDLKVNDSATHAPDEIRRWAEKIMSAQGCPCTLTREASGYHLYIPCPDCLETHGRRELDDPKYAINLSMIAGLGEFAYDAETGSPLDIINRMDVDGKREFGSSVCMRTCKSREPHRRSIESLLNMGTVTDRYPDIQTRAVLRGGVGSAEVEEMWEPDPITGNMAPPPPGDVVPLSELPAEHPAVKYLTDRLYNIRDLEAQFRCAFCTKEYDGSEKGIFYRVMPAKWKDTPQHRIVFCSMIDGTPLTWQARVIEKVSDDGLTKLMLHPYAGGFYEGAESASAVERIRKDLMKYAQSSDDPVVIVPGSGGTWGYLWSRTHVRSNPAAEWQPVPPFDEVKDGSLRFRPSKYRTAKYSSRQMMGWDAAIARAERDTDPRKWVVLCEGPLDAARVGPGGVAVIGSSLSPENAKKIVGRFHMVFLAFDSDKAGIEATQRINKTLSLCSHSSPMLQLVCTIALPAGKDPGDLSSEEFTRLMNKARKVALRRY